MSPLGLVVMCGKQMMIYVVYYSHMCEQCIVIFSYDSNYFIVTINIEMSQPFVHVI
jgi:hypothetical protein